MTEGWVAYRVRRRHRDRLLVTALDAEGSPGATRKLAKVKRPQQLSRPAIEGDRLVVAVARSGRNELVRYELRGDRRPRRRTLISTRTAALAGPSIAGKKIAYVRTTARRQTLRIKGAGGGKGRSLYRRRSGPPTLWTTAISGNRVLVTMVKRGGGSKIISVPR